MIEQQDRRVHTEHAVLDIGEDIGALVIYTREALRGQEIEVSPRDDARQRTHTVVLERQVQRRRSVFAALFLALPAGDYRIWCDDPTVPNTVTIVGGAVAEINWRASAMTRVTAIKSAHSHNTPQPASCYPPGKPVSAAPMAAAPLRYAADGQVAWDEIWTDFCDLALAGGPPHRGDLLSAVAVSDTEATSDAYARVVTEIERGISLATQLATTRSATPGWVGVVCADETMAAWLMEAILAENVIARCEGATLLLPAGPSFRLEKEIKNVVTVVAKTHHYWMEHRTL